MSIHGYLRVSTDAQTTENQKKSIRDAGFSVDIWYSEDGVSGTTRAMERTEFVRMMSATRPGDTVVCTALDRLGRSAADILNTVEMFKRTGVKLRVMALDGTDITSSTGKMIITCMAAMAELERNMLADRTRDGLARTQAAGTKLGRPLTIPPATLTAMCKDKTEGATFDVLAAKYNLPRNSIARNVKKWGTNVIAYEQEYNAREAQYALKAA